MINCEKRNNGNYKNGHWTCLALTGCSVFLFLSVLPSYNCLLLCHIIFLLFNYSLLFFCFPSSVFYLLGFASLLPIAPFFLALYFLLSFVLSLPRDIVSLKGQNKGGTGHHLCVNRGCTCKCLLFGLDYWSSGTETPKVPRNNRFLSFCWIWGLIATVDQCACC